MDTVELLASLVQNHVPEQPWGSYGNDPVPVEMWFNNDRWTVRFVLGLSGTGSKRRWGSARGGTLEEALKSARSQQHADARAKEDWKGPGTGPGGMSRWIVEEAGGS